MDWFKMQTVWGASIERFSDAEAGRFIKALFAYVRGGVEYGGGSGREDPIIWQALETLRGDIEAFKQSETIQKEKKEDISERRRLAAKARWDKQKDANACKCIDEDANASTCIICNANASENKNKNQSFNNNNKQNARAREGWLTDEDIHEAMQRDAQIEQAAKGAGLNVSETVMVKARDYAREYGMDKLIDAINKTALAAQKPSWKYVEGVLKNGARENEHRGDHRRDDGERKPSGKYSQFFADVS